MFQVMDYSGTREDNYQLVINQMEHLVQDEPNRIVNLANTAALLNQFLKGINWVGFYLLEGDELVLGPFQGLPACVRIPVGKGVCGTAAQRRETIRVADVQQFPGHIACDSASRSEIVVPVIKEGQLVGVLDIDSPKENRFDQVDQEWLEQLIARLAVYLSRRLVGSDTLEILDRSKPTALHIKEEDFHEIGICNIWRRLFLGCGSCFSENTWRQINGGGLFRRYHGKSQL